MSIFANMPFDMLVEQYSWASVKDLMNLVMLAPPRIRNKKIEAAMYQLFLRDTEDAITAQKQVLPQLQKLGLLKKENTLLRRAIFDRLKSSYLGKDKKPLNFSESEKLSIVLVLYPEEFEFKNDVTHKETKNNDNVDLFFLFQEMLKDNGSGTLRFRSFSGRINETEFSSLKEVEALMVYHLKNDNSELAQLNAAAILSGLTARIDIEDKNLLLMLDRLLVMFCKSGSPEEDDAFIFGFILKQIVKNITPTQCSDIAKKLLSMRSEFHSSVQSFITCALALLIERVETGELNAAMEEDVLSNLANVKKSRLDDIIPILAKRANTKGAVTTLLDIIINNRLWVGELFKNVDLASLSEIKNELLEKLRLNDGDGRNRRVIIRILEEIAKCVKIIDLLEIKEALLQELSHEDPLVKIDAIRALGSVASRIAASELASIEAALNTASKDSNAKVQWVSAGALCQLAFRADAPELLSIINQLIQQFENSSSRDKSDGAFKEYEDALRTFAQLAISAIDKNVFINITSTLVSLLSYVEGLSRLTILALEAIIKRLNSLGHPLLLEIKKILLKHFSSQFNWEIRAFNNDYTSLTITNYFEFETKLFNLIKLIDQDSAVEVLRNMIKGNDVSAQIIAVMMLKSLAASIDQKHLLPIANDLLSFEHIALNSDEKKDILTKLVVTGVEAGEDFSSFLEKAQESDPEFSHTLEIMSRAAELMKKEIDAIKPQDKNFMLARRSLS